MRSVTRVSTGIALAAIAAAALSIGTARAGRAPAPPQASAPAGQTSTRLPDGRWLVVGGETNGRPSADARVVDPQQAGADMQLSSSQARAWHSATVLPDGTVLIAGGIGANGLLAAAPEIFDPATATFRSLTVDGAAERSGHTATLLTDGRVLLAGGEGLVEGSAPAEIWTLDAEGWTAQPITGPRARTGHTATLLPDGRVLLSGGRDARGRARRDAEAFDPLTGQFSSVEPPRGRTMPFLAESRPRDGAEEVELDARLTLRFSTSLAFDRTDDDPSDDPNNDETFQLSSGELPVALAVIPAENGRLVFLTPELPLEPETTYQLAIAGAVDDTGARLAPVTITFRTKAAARPPDAAEADESWEPNARNGWRTDRPGSLWQSLPPLMAAEGITALSGQVLRLDGRPLADVTLEMEGRSAQTDRTGRFLLLLAGQPSEWCELLIDGRSASRGQRKYGIFEVGLQVTAGQTTVLPYTIWMPRLDTAHAVAISSPTTSEVVVTTPSIPGLELHVPAGTVIRDHDGQVVRELSITPIPVDRPPFPLAKNVDVPVYFTVQPGGAYVHSYGPSRGAWLVYPNYRQEYPGKRVQFFHYDTEPRGWYVYGLGTVTPNGAQVVPDPKTRFYEFTGAMINSGSSPPADAEPPGDECCNDGDPVNLATGLFELEQTDLYLPDVLPISVTRTYRTRDPDIRPFGRGTTHPYAMFLWSALQYQEADLILPDGGRIHYVRTSAGTGWVDAVFEHKETATTSATPTSFYKSELRWNGNGWDLRLKDGTVYVFGENAPLQAIRDRYGNTITIHRTGGQSGNITRVVSPHGRWVEFTYSGSLITQVKDNIGRTVSYTYDGQTRLWKVTDPLNQVTEYTYDTDHRMLTVKNRNGVVYVTNEYYTAAPTLGWVKKQTFADGGTHQFAYTVVNGKSTQTDITDPRGYIRRVTLNPDGYTLSDTRALGTPEQRAHTTQRQSGTQYPTTSNDSLGRQSTYTYDAVGNLRTVTRLAGTPEAVTTTYTYESALNQISTITDPLNHTVTFGYDANGSPTSITDALQHQTIFTYNPAGQLTSRRDALQNMTQFEYSGADLVRITDTLGQTTRFTDAIGRVTSITDPLGRVTRYQHDALNRLISSTNPLGYTTTFEYYPEGQLQALVDANNNRTSYTYSSMGLAATRLDALLRAESFQYDKNGNLTQSLDRKGQLTSRTYDPLNRLKQITFADNSSIVYSYDEAGRVAQIADSVAGTIARGYDGLDRLTSESGAQGVIAYTHDAAGRRATMTVSGQAAVIYGYDDANRLTTVTQGSATTHIDYDQANRRTSLTLPNGLVTEYTYDAASQVTGLTYRHASTILGVLTYAYDSAGNRREVGGSFARTTLPLSATSLGYDAANQLTGWNDSVFTYDANGSLVSSGLRNHIWNPRQELAAIGGDVSASFQYDAVGRRVAKVVNGVETGFLHDRDDAVQEVRGGSLVFRLIGGRVDEWFARQESAGARYALLDALGSTIALADSTGAITTQLTYEPYGRASVSGSNGTNTFEFTGRDRDTTGLYYYRARYYNPDYGRFASEDHFDGDLNAYGYAAAAPTMYVDPSGLLDVRRNITESIVDQSQIPGGAVANTTITGVGFVCWCTCDSEGYRLQSRLIIGGRMLLPRIVTRVPAVDRSVRDTASARRHEYAWHIDPAVNAVRQLVEPAEKPYPTEPECEAECDGLRAQARDVFLAELRRTQQLETARARRR